MRQYVLLMSINDHLLVHLDNLRDVYNKPFSGTEKAFKEGLITGYAKCLSRYEDAMQKYTSVTSEDGDFLRYMLSCVRAYEEVNIEKRIRDYYVALNNKITEVKTEYADTCISFGECEMTFELESKIEGLSEATSLFLDMFKEFFNEES